MCASCVREKVLFKTRVCRAGWRRGHTRNSHSIYTIQLGAHIIGLIEAQKSDEGQTFRRRPGSGSMIRPAGLWVGFRTSRSTLMPTSAAERRMTLQQQQLAKGRK